MDWNIMYVNLVCSIVCYFACPGIHSDKIKVHLKSNVKWDQMWCHELGEDIKLSLATDLMAAKIA
jgi:hypothetical protein